MTDILRTPPLPYDPTDPNTRYESKNIGTWNTASDVNMFFASHTPENNWSGLKLGNYVAIGTTQWEIAGFNCEHNRTASDGTTYDNGYGICMIPKTTLGKMTWNNTNTLNGAYKSSTIHTIHLATAANNLKNNLLGDHLINRNVLLSSSVDYSNRSNAYTWTTSYCTLMSVGQMTGTFASHRNKYDDGEANYKLPVFNYENYVMGSSFWLRGVYDYYEITSSYRVWVVYNGTISGNAVYINDEFGARPLIYLR